MVYLPFSMNFSTALPLSPRSVFLTLLSVVLGWFLLSPPLAADCQCTVSVTLAPLTWTSTSTSTGACNKTTLWWLYRDEIQVGHKDCGITTTCTVEDTRSTACLRTGTHTVRLHCGCGKLGTDVHGNSICDFDSGDDATGFFVNTTPTVGVEVQGPDVTGRAEVTAPYPSPTRPTPESGTSSSSPTASASRGARTRRRAAPTPSPRSRPPAGSRGHT